MQGAGTDEDELPALLKTSKRSQRDAGRKKEIKKTKEKKPSPILRAEEARTAAAAAAAACRAATSVPLKNKRTPPPTPHRARGYEAAASARVRAGLLIACLRLIVRTLITEDKEGHKSRGAPTRRRPRPLGESGEEKLSGGRDLITSLVVTKSQKHL